MNTKFTPGPWKLGHAIATGQRCIIGDGDTVVALLPDETMHCTYKPDDAHLLTAAPELLEALRDLVGWIPGDAAWHTDEPGKSVARALAAIAAATGDNS